MRSTNPFKDQSSLSLSKKLIPWTLYALLAIAIVHLYLYPVNLYSTDQFPTNTPITITSSYSSSSSSSSSSPSQEEKRTNAENACNYTNGKWVKDRLGPLYNGTSCGTIKDGQNCMAHGRPDVDYLHWRWRPKSCHLPRFDPNTFLQLMRNKHVAFVGDSMARNQLESLLCMISTVSDPKLVHVEGEDNRFRKWHFNSHNVNVSIYWSPFLVKGIEKNEIANFNKLFLDSVDERWMSDLDRVDMVVLSVGHWFLHSAVFLEGDSVLGCHFCDGQNYTEIGFYEVFRKAIKTTLKGISEKVATSGKGIDVILTTFSPHHFEGEWDKLGACPKTKPYKEGEKKLEGMDEEMRKVEVAEVEKVKESNNAVGRLRIEALDITKLSLLRPDGHPGPYLYPFPFANGIQERVQNDCVHWCLPGPVDTWNEILLDVMKRWEGQHRRG